MIFAKSTGGTVNGVPAGTESSALACSGVTHAAVSPARSNAERMARAEAGMNGSETTE